MEFHASRMSVVRKAPCRLFLMGLQSNLYQPFRVMCGASNDLLFSKLGKCTTSYA